MSMRSTKPRGRDFNEVCSDRHVGGERLQCADWSANVASSPTTGLQMAGFMTTRGVEPGTSCCLLAKRSGATAASIHIYVRVSGESGQRRLRTAHASTANSGGSVG
jgi:hypothetical protein